MPKKQRLQKTLPELMMHVLDRLAAGETFSAVVEQTGITARVSDAIAAQRKKAYLVVQEGGTSTELYVSSYESEADAQEARVDCGRGAYRTTPAIEVPGGVAALGEDFYSVVEKVVRAMPEMESLEEA